MSANQFAYVWEYTVDPGQKAEFLSAYKPDGAWTRLMSRHGGFLGTELLGDVDNDNRFITVDYWTSKSERDAFRTEFASEYAQLDADCESCTLSESFIGDFFVVGGCAAE